MVLSKEDLNLRKKQIFGDDWKKANRPLPNPPLKILKDVIAYIEVYTDIHTGFQNRKTGAVAKLLISLGATVTVSLTSKNTHVVFGEGRQHIFEKAVNDLKIPVVSNLWAECCWTNNRIMTNYEDFPGTGTDFETNLDKRKILQLMSKSGKITHKATKNRPKTLEEYMEFSRREAKRKLQQQQNYYRKQRQEKSFKAMIEKDPTKKANLMTKWLKYYEPYKETITDAMVEQEMERMEKEREETVNQQVKAIEKMLTPNLNNRKAEPRVNKKLNNPPKNIAEPESCESDDEDQNLVYTIEDSPVTPILSRSSQNQLNTITPEPCQNQNTHQKFSKIITSTQKINRKAKQNKITRVPSPIELNSSFEDDIWANAENSLVFDNPFKNDNRTEKQSETQDPFADLLARSPAKSSKRSSLATGTSKNSSKNNSNRRVSFSPLVSCPSSSNPNSKRSSLLSQNRRRSNLTDQLTGFFSIEEEADDNLESKENLDPKYNSNNNNDNPIFNSDCLISNPSNTKNSLELTPSRKYFNNYGHSSITDNLQFLSGSIEKSDENSSTDEANSSFNLDFSRLSPKGLSPARERKLDAKSLAIKVTPVKSSLDQSIFDQSRISENTSYFYSCREGSDSSTRRRSNSVPNLSQTTTITTKGLLRVNSYSALDRIKSKMMDEEFKILVMTLEEDYHNFTISNKNSKRSTRSKTSRRSTIFESISKSSGSGVGSNCSNGNDLKNKVYPKSARKPMTAKSRVHKSKKMLQKNTVRSHNLSGSQKRKSMPEINLKLDERKKVRKLTEQGQEHEQENKVPIFFQNDSQNHYKDEDREISKRISETSLQITQTTPSTNQTLHIIITNFTPDQREKILSIISRSQAKNEIRQSNNSTNSSIISINDATNQNSINQKNLKIVLCGSATDPRAQYLLNLAKIPSKKFKRTLTFVIALARNLQILNHNSIDWLENCLTSNKILDAEKFKVQKYSTIINDKKLGRIIPLPVDVCQMRDDLLKNQSPYDKGSLPILDLHFYLPENLKYHSFLRSIIETCNGAIYDKFNAKTIEKINTILVQPEEMNVISDMKEIMDRLPDSRKKERIKFVDVRWLYNSVEAGKVQGTESYKLGFLGVT